MGFLDRLLGRDDESQYRQPQPMRPSARTDDEIAIERYRYLLRTAPPETIEQVHAEAFAKLTPEQRRQVYDDLKRGPEQPAGDDAGSLARAATRSEIREPGTLERSFGSGSNGMRGGTGFGSMLGGSLLGTVAGYVIGSAIVSAFLPDAGFADAAGDAGDASGGDAAADDSGWGETSGGDFGGGDWGGSGGADFGGGFDF